MMLSRVANNLYWMSRYLERAEHTARLIDVNLDLMADRSPAAIERAWERVFASLRLPVLAGNLTFILATLQAIDDPPFRVQTAIYLVFTSPEYAVQI